MISASTYAAAHEHAVAIHRAERGRLVVSGVDRATYLQGMLTNDIVALAAGHGCYAAYLTPQGRMIADLFVYELGDVILLSVPREQKDAVLARLDQFVFSEDVQLGDVSESLFAIAVVGPRAAAVVSGILGWPAQDIDALPVHGNHRAQFGGGVAIVTRVTDTGVPGYDLYVEQLQAAALLEALAAAGTAIADPDTAETLRIESGMPMFNRDMDAQTIPLEAAIESRAISLTKGCYVGQEVIIRVLHRGHGRVARKLVGLLFDEGAIPPAGAEVTADSRPIGHLTSSAMSPALHRPIALAYLQREFLAPGTEVAVGDQRAVVSEMPFVRGGTA
jgi:folate-binding protein YgfZ